MDRVETSVYLVDEGSRHDTGYQLWVFGTLREALDFVNGLDNTAINNNTALGSESWELKGRTYTYRITHFVVTVEVPRKED